LKKVAEQRKLDTARWMLAAPSKDAVRSVAGVLGIKYRALADGEFNHTSALVLVDVDGRILARTETFGPIPEQPFPAAVREAARVMLRGGEPPCRAAAGADCPGPASADR